MWKVDSDLTNWLRVHPGNKGPDPRSIVSAADVAAELAFYYPTHFFKFQRTLFHELAKPYPASPASPFGFTDLTLVDIGAGVGTATLAVVDMLAEWQVACLKLGHSPAAVHLRAISVDNNSIKERVRADLYAGMAAVIPEHLLSMHDSPSVSNRFPTT
jgi:hypothetical protein